MHGASFSFSIRKGMQGASSKMFWGIKTCARTHVSDPWLSRSCACFPLHSFSWGVSRVLNARHLGKPVPWPCFKLLALFSHAVRVNFCITTLRLQYAHHISFMTWEVALWSSWLRFKHTWPRYCSLLRSLKYSFLRQHLCTRMMMMMMKRRKLITFSVYTQLYTQTRVVYPDPVVYTEVLYLFNEADYLEVHS